MVDYCSEGDICPRCGGDVPSIAGGDGVFCDGLYVDVQAGWRLVQHDVLEFAVGYGHALEFPDIDYDNDSELLGQHCWSERGNDGWAHGVGLQQSGRHDFAELYPEREGELWLRFDVPWGEGLRVPDGGRLGGFGGVVGAVIPARRGFGVGIWQVGP